MTHPRRQIREAFKARLIEAATDAAGRVYNSRIAPIGDDKDELPAILIYSRDEKIDPDKGFGVDGEDSYTERELKLVTEGIVRGGETVDDVLDDLAEQMEAALDDWQIPGFESARVRLIESDIDLVTEHVRFPIGAIGLLWRVTYRAKWRPRPPGDEMPSDVYAILSGHEPEQIVDGGGV